MNPKEKKIRIGNVDGIAIRCRGNIGNFFTEFDEEVMGVGSTIRLIELCLNMKGGVPPPASVDFYMMTPSSGKTGGIQFTAQRVGNGYQIDEKAFQISKKMDRRVQFYIPNIKMEEIDSWEFTLGVTDPQKKELNILEKFILITVGGIALYKVFFST